MCSDTIASLHRYSNRFLRSTDLSRDFNDPNGLQGYCLTDFGRSCLVQIADGLRPDSGRRAWRLTGDFGTGKSSFALLLANTLCNGNRRLPKGLRERVLEVLPEAKRLRYMPVLVVGNREPMASAILRSFQQVLEQLSVEDSKSALELSIAKALRRKIVNEQETLRLIQEINAQVIRSGKARGTLLIIDEVGKFLEFAALNPEEQDIYFLQQLAEMANRSGKQPLMVVCLLHQGFNAYAEQLTEATQREWEKIAGRFDEILFQHPLDQIAMLVSSAINPDVDRIPPPLAQEAEASLSKAIELGWYGTSANRETLWQLRRGFFPLDPMLLPVLVRTFQRFGQNERSLFSLLCSHEPFGLRAFCNGPLTDETRPYQLADFYDYIRTSFGHRLTVASYRTHWNVIESVIEARNTDDALELRILKTVGVLNLLNTDDLKPTEEAICWAVGGNLERERSKAAALLRRLVESRILHFRGEVRGYSLWPYTSVDIDARLEEAKRAIPLVSQVADAISEQLDNRPIVARAHYIETGNLRYFDVIYCRPDELADQAKDYQTQADGFILVPLCETAAESRIAQATAGQIVPRRDSIRLVAVPRSLHHLRQSALDALRWEWVQSKTPELNNDPFAREEVQIHLQEARNRLQRQVQAYIGLVRLSASSSLTWFYFDRDEKLQTKTFGSGRAILSLLSTLCDGAFSQAPRIKNELINRHNPSSAATAARVRLLELMFACSDKPELGLPSDRKPPEKSMYLSVLQATGLHTERDGRWCIGIPAPASDVANVRPVLEAIRNVLAGQPDTRVSIRSLMEKLRRPPYGLRDGLFPILLSVVAIANEQEIAFYENGTFLHQVGRDVFVRMTRAPERFDIQYCRIEGVRTQLFHQLAQVLELAKTGDKDVELLDIVRSLCEFVAQLPEFVRKTQRLSATALAVRHMVLEAREPALLVFHDLPQACGFRAFEVDTPASTTEADRFVLRLQHALDELRAAFPNLQSRIEIGLAHEFGYGDEPAGQYRRKLAERAEGLLAYVTENKLRAFAFRLRDESLPEADWLRSVGGVLSLRPPDKWKDEDEDTFVQELERLSSRFKRVESAAFGKGKHGKAMTALRMAITQVDGTERQEVVHTSAEEEALLRQLKDEIGVLIRKNKRLGLAAASRAIWDQLEPAQEGSRE